MAPIEFISPLDETHLAQFQEALQNIEVAKKHLALAKRAQIDVTQQEKAIVDGEATIRRLMTTYFPNGAPTKG